MAGRGTALVEAVLDGGLLQTTEAAFTITAGGHWLATRTRDPLGFAGPLAWVRLLATAAPAQVTELSDGVRRWPVELVTTDLPTSTVTAVWWPKEMPEPAAKAPGAAGARLELREGDEIWLTARGAQVSAVIDGVTLGPAPVVTVVAKTPGPHALRVFSGSVTLEWSLEVSAAASRAPDGAGGK